MNIEILCTTMHQKDLSKYNEMNIKANVIFANQDDRHEYIEEVIEGNTVKMITTPYRGVGNNRNMALIHSTADILVFSDDDMVYKDDAKEVIIQAFQELPNADIIIFNIGSIGDTVSQRRVNDVVKRVRIYNALNYGMPRVAIRRQSLQKSNIWISSLFGGGTKYCSGEDNLFIVNCLKSKMKIYSYPKTIGNVKVGESTWFKGYNEKYFFDNGAWLEAAFPVLKNILIWYFVFRFSQKTKLSKREIYTLHIEGIKAFRKNIGYNEWMNKRLNLGK